MNLNFTFKGFLLIFLSGLYSITITVGPDPSNDYTTIQEGIGAASDGDIVLVESGTNTDPITYTENLIIESEIRLISTGGYQTTIIDGSGGATRTMGSTVTVRPESGSAFAPNNVEIDGFTITGGVGNSMNWSTPSGMVTGKFGGGIMAFNTSPKIKNNNIKDNGNASTANGGGIIAIDSAEDWSFNDREWELNPELPPVTDDLDFSNNIFYGNDSDYGHSLFISGFSQRTTDLSNSTFDCFSTTYQNTTEYWVKGELVIFNYEGSEGIEPIYTDVWVNPETGVDQGNYIGDIEHPFKTIEFALGMIYVTENNPITIHLAPGNYIDEDYPIIMVSNISLIGSDNAESILDAQGLSRVIHIQHIENVTLENVLIRGGYQHEYPGGGGLSVWWSNNVTITNSIFTDNIAGHGGGFEIRQSTNINLSNLDIFNNSASDSGGGFAIKDCTDRIEADSLNVYNNFAQYGAGGIYFYGDGGSISLENSIIRNNSSESKGGGIKILVPGSSYINNCIIKNNYATWGGGIALYSDNINEFLVISNSIISGNHTTVDSHSSGTAFYADADHPNVTFINTTIANNTSGSPIYFFTTNSSTSNMILNIVNSIIYNNNEGSFGCAIGASLGINQELINISYSNIQESTNSFEINWYLEDMNLSIDPEFVEDDPYFNLSSNSPCIDAGTSDIDFDGIPDITHFYGEAPDMGASEYMPNQLDENGDLNGDGSINVIDIVALVNIILNDLDTEGADYNGDGAVNVIDVVALVQFVLNN